MKEIPGIRLDIAIPTDDGRWVSEKHERIASIIQDYDPALHLAYIPPDKREPGDVPFAVIHTPNDAPAYIVATFDDCDERILEHLWSIDNQHGDVLSRMDAHNAAIKAVELKERMDREEASRDLTASIVRSPLNTYKHNGVKYQ
jgi:hypothetical protein